MPCSYCLNADVDDELTSDCDLSYHSVGRCSFPYRFMMRSGDGKPIALELEVWDHHWQRVGVYVPKYCPECGRYLVEHEKYMKGKVKSNGC